MTNDNSITGGHDARTVRVRRKIGADVQRVWAALVEEEQLRLWFNHGRLEPRVGGAVWFEREDGVVMIDGEVLTFEPPSELSYTWRPDPARRAIVRFSLRSVDATATWLTVEETELTEAQTPGALAGWELQLQRLDRWLAGERIPFDWMAFERRVKRVQRMLDGGDFD